MLSTARKHAWPYPFLCFINDFPQCTNMLSYLFADDTTCLDSDKCIKNLIQRVNLELQKISNWYCANKLAVNTNKTKFIIFRSRGKPINMDGLSLQLNFNEIGHPNNPDKIHNIERIFSTHPNPVMQNYKLLGVYFDEYLSFTKHVQILEAKLCKYLFLLDK